MPAALVLPRPFAIQQAVLDAPQRFKLLPWGRRAGKTRLEFVASLTGHGPGWPDAPLHPGVLHGWDVAWIARDAPQFKSIWDEEIVPRCDGLPGVTINHSDHFVAFQGLGRLHLRSAENIHSVRGIGAKLKGIVLDEAAWWDFEGAWKIVLRPALLDHVGWAIVGSTTNAGHDGNRLGVAPSYFNRLYQQSVDGTLDPDWGVWHATAEDNPHIRADEWAKFVAGYDPDGLELAQEVYAQLVTASGGLLFGYLAVESHQPAALETGGPTPGTRRVVSADWGWSDPAATLWIETDEATDGIAQSRVYREWWPTETLPAAWARAVVERSQGEGIDLVLIDEAARARGQDGSPTIYEQMVGVFQAAGIRLATVPKGPDSIKNGVQLLHTYLWTGRGAYPPLLTISRDCPRLWTELRGLRRGDPLHNVHHDPNLPAPHQADHGTDALRYWAMSRPQPADVPAEERLRRQRLAQVAAPGRELLALQEQRAQQAVAQRLPEPVRAPDTPVKRGRPPHVQPWRR